MTTARSPLHVLKRQADLIATSLKQAERGETITYDPGGKIASARRENIGVKVGIVMDDKVITIEFPWIVIRDTSERGLSEYVLKQMSEAREQ